MRREDTKRILAHAMLEAVKESSFHEITVSDIVSKCGASRTTFYNHFADKYAVVVWLFIESMKEEYPNPDESITFGEYCRRTVRVLKSLSEVINTVGLDLGQNSLGIFLGRFFYVTSEHCFKKKQGVKILREEDRDLLEFNVVGGLQILFAWMKRGMPGSEDYLLRVYQRLSSDYIDIVYSEKIKMGEILDILENLYIADRGLRSGKREAPVNTYTEIRFTGFLH